jgi:hypothetical protein
MKKSSTLFLKLAIGLMALAVITLCAFVLPVVAGSRDINVICFVLLGLYLPAVPFLVALYQTRRLLGQIDKNEAFSQISVSALKIIKYCGFTIGALFVANMPGIYMAAQHTDAPGLMVIGMLFIFAAVVIGAFAGLMQKLMQSAVDMKSENDLTV